MQVDKIGETDNKLARNRAVKGFNQGLNAVLVLMGKHVLLDLLEFQVFF